MIPPACRSLPWPPLCFDMVISAFTIHKPRHSHGPGQPPMNYILYIILLTPGPDLANNMYGLTV